MIQLALVRPAQLGSGVTALALLVCWLMHFAGDLSQATFCIFWTTVYSAVKILSSITVAFVSAFTSVG